MGATELRLNAEREAVLRTIRARLIGARWEVRQALLEAADLHLGAPLAIKLDHAVFELDSALKSDALKPK